MGMIFFLFSAVEILCNVAVWLLPCISLSATGLLWMLQEPIVEIV